MPLDPHGPVGEQPNHPLAPRMGVIAGVSHNIVIGTVMGAFSIMLASVQVRLGVKLEQASAGMLLMLVGGAVLAPFVGVLIGRFSLRKLMMAGTIFMALGFVILGLTSSYPVYLAVFALLFGPALSFAGGIGPATLVTRWYNKNRGMALGLVHLPIMVAIMPIAMNWFLSNYSAQTAYFALAAIGVFILLPLLAFAQDYPPNRVVPIATDEKRTADGSWSIGQLLFQSRFWALAIAYGASTTGSVLLSALLIPMGESWDFTRSQAAALASIMAVVGIAGSVLFGWTADKLGGGRTLALIGCNCAILWSFLLLDLPFFMVAIVVGLLGLHGVGAVPAFGRGLSDAYGQASYSRGVGLASVISLPFKGVAMLGASRIATETGSFAIPITIMACVFASAIVCGLYAARGSKIAVTPSELKLA